MAVDAAEELAVAAVAQASKAELVAKDDDAATVDEDEEEELAEAGAAEEEAAEAEVSSAAAIAVPALSVIVMRSPDSEADFQLLARHGCESTAISSSRAYTHGSTPFAQHEADQIVKCDIQRLLLDTDGKRALLACSKPRQTRGKRDASKNLRAKTSSLRPSTRNESKRACRASSTGSGLARLHWRSSDLQATQIRGANDAVMLYRCRAQSVSAHLPSAIDRTRHRGRFPKSARILCSKTRRRARQFWPRRPCLQPARTTLTTRRVCSSDLA